MRNGDRNRTAILGGIAVLFSLGQALARVPYPVHPDYEDTVRIVLLWNTPLGRGCPGSPPPVGLETKDFVVASLDTNYVPNVKIFKTWDCVPQDADFPGNCTNPVTLQQVRNAFGGRSPHVIVHSNAGWSGWNGPNLENILSWAVQNYVGIVEIGDDASGISNEIFGLGNVNGWPMQLQTATWLNRSGDSLMLKTHLSRDNFVNGSIYPGLNGIIRNANTLNGNATFYFKPFAAGGRCEADADLWQLTPGFENKITFLGCQQGYNFQGPDNLPYGGTAQQGYIGAIDQWSVLAALQDSIRLASQLVVRRGVALSLQPQYLANTTASRQLVYDAIMYASLAHTLKPADSLRLSVTSDTITAGQFTTIRALVYSQNATPDTSLAQRVEWQIDPAVRQPGDSITASTGSSTQFTATVAYRIARVIGRFVDPNFGTELLDTAYIYVRPAAAHHLVIEGSNGAMNSPNRDAPVGGTGRVTIGTGQSSTDDIGGIFAILRDRYGNYVGRSTNTTWGVLPGGSAVVTAEATDQPSGRGRANKVGFGGSDQVWAKSNTYSFLDTILVTVDAATYSALRIVYGTQRQVVPSVTMTTQDTALFIVQGLRDDGQWVDVTGTWAMGTPNLRPRIPPPTGSLWNFSPQDTGSSFVRVTRGSLSATLSVRVNPGSPNRLTLYKREGLPDVGGNDPYPKYLQWVAGDTLLMVAKLFDGQNVWLSDYERAPRNALITWELKGVAGGSGPLLYSNSHLNRYIPRIAGRTDTLIAWAQKDASTRIADTIIVTIVPGPPHHVEIVGDTVGRTPVAGDVLFSQADSIRSFFTVVQDRFNNHISFAANALWTSRDTLTATAQRGNTVYGEGVVSRATLQESSTWILTSYTASTGGTLVDSIRVQLQSITYDSLRIVNSRGRVLDSLVLSIDQSDTLFAQARRSDNLQWVTMPVAWSKTAELQTTPQPPANSSQWLVQPTQPGTGFVRISRPGSVSDSIFARFLPGAPFRMVLYPALGDPAGVTAYPTSQTISVTAGTSKPIVAKIFDRNGVWLSQYERLDSSWNLISWNIEALEIPLGTRPDTLSIRQGHQTTFTPIRAWTVYRVTAQFSNGGAVLNASIMFRVDPDAASMLVIEQSYTDYPKNRQNPYDPVVFGAASYRLYAYAILRDRFENFVAFSNPTDWRAVDTTVVTVRAGALPQYGEGEMTRGSRLDTTRIIARDKNNPSLVDTVRVRIDNVAYSALRIVAVNDTNRIDSLKINSGRDTTLQVQGLRTYDNVWVNLPLEYPSQWSFQSSVLPGQTGNGGMFKFTAADTGWGFIIVSANGPTPDTIAVSIKKGGPARLTLYPKEGQPGAPDNPPYSVAINPPAGVSVVLVANIFDRTGLWLAEYQMTPSLSGQITWAVVESIGVRDSSGLLSKPTGHRVSYLPINAYRQVKVIASLGELRDTITLTIVPGREYRVYIESNADWLASPNDPNPIDTVKIPDSTLTRNVNALVRDSLGNFVRFSDTTSWGNLTPDIVSVASGWAQRGEGVITRDLSIREGLTRIYAVDKRGFMDTAWVQLLPYRYVALRIVGGAATVIDSGSGGRTLTVNTNQTATLVVQGLRSDTTLWENVPGDWGATSGLRFDKDPPSGQPAWSFSPTDTGSGYIKVALDDAQPDSIRAVFTPGPPTRVSFEIVTPPDQRVAGSPIAAVVKVYNQDGLYPDTICLPVYYQDTLGTGGRDSIPMVIIGDTAVSVTKRPDSSGRAQQCFAAGVDTVRFVLYYAPPDTMHRLYVNVNGLQASTPPFLLYPGALDTILLTVNGKFLDTLVVHAGEPDKYIRAEGYDRFGNRIGMVTSNWTVDGTLHEPALRTNRGQVPYGAGSAIMDEQGRLIATAADDSTVSGRIVVMVLGPLTKLTQATTRDRDGNGYLDALELRFDLPVEILDPSIAAGITAVYLADTLRGVSITPLDSTGKLFLVTLQENTTTKPQTGWIPAIRIDNRGGELGNADSILTLSGAGKVIDGAGPVIWTVVKWVSNPDDRTTDRVVITFSEPVLDSSGVQLRFRPDAIPPESLLYVWARTPSGGDTLIAAFAGIADITTLDADEIEIMMTNGFDLTSEYRISIRVDTTEGTRSEITDNPRNFPHVHNVAVRVQVQGKLAGVMVVGPNPMGVTSAHGETTLNLRDPRQALEWAARSGIVFEVKILMPGGGQDSTLSRNFRVTGRLQIYDLAGNLVYHRENMDNLIPPEWFAQGGEIKRLVFYWNGMSDRNRRSSPGVYRAILRLKSYPDGKDYVYREAVGVKP